MELKTIDINAKEWFDRVNGNSYFSGVIVLNYGTKTQKELKMPFQYGYGDHYIDVASRLLINQGIIAAKLHNNGNFPALWRYCQENNIILRTNKQENCKKREL